MKGEKIETVMATDKKLFDECSLENNCIFIFEDITETLAERVINQILYLDYQFKIKNIPQKQRNIRILINSAGGSIDAGLSIYDTLKYVNCDITTIGLGRVASMAAILLTAGNKRYVTENTEIIIHQPLGSISGQATDIIIAAERIAKAKQKIIQILTEATNKNNEEIAKDIERDKAMNAEEAKQYGLIDDILTKASIGDDNEL